MTSPRNPILYETLRAKFGEVRITNADQPRIAHRVPDPMRPGRFTTQADQRGEQYTLDCPFCGDDRRRLYVSYTYGRKDPATGKRNYSLWYCHNEKCHESHANRKLFRSMTAVPIARRRGHCPVVSNSASALSSSPPRVISLPEGLIPISNLPPTHPAPAYLLQRGFDLAYLAQTWNVSFCDWCLQGSPVATNRIVIPILRPAQMFAPAADMPQSPVLAGWQARIVPGMELLGGADAKYLFAAGMQKSALLYGLHLAIATQGPVYLVEGPTDCWRIGPGAVAIFGKDLSQTQKLLLVHHFAARPIIVMLDPEADEEAVRIQHTLFLTRGGSQGDSRVVVADLPAHREDPAACTREEITTAASQALGQPAEGLGLAPGHTQRH